MSDSSSESDRDDEIDEHKNGDSDSEEAPTTFASLGLEEVLCDAAASMGWKTPSKIQREAIPVALDGHDVIGLAETGSGKTGAFALPMLHDLIKNPNRLFGLVLTPTRELAYQIAEQIDKLGHELKVKTVTLVGGMDIVEQAVALGKRPHIIIATPGRLMDHLTNTKGFTLKKSLKFLVLDEADRILNMDFEKEVNQILANLPREGRRNMLFSATMTKKVAKLQRASLRDPVRVEVSSKYQTVDKLHQYYCFIPHKYKEIYLVHVLNEMQGNSFIVFSSTCAGTMKIALMLRGLGISAIPLNGNMSQNKRLGSLNKFKAKSRSVLVATDVASRGLDIPHVDVVLNYDIPTHSKDYIHRVGRTARAGRSGKAITFVSQYDIELYQRIEQLIGKKLPLYETVDDEVMTFRERVEEASRRAKIEYKEMEEKTRDRKRKRGDDNFDDSQNYVGVRKRVKGGDGGGGGGGRGGSGGRGRGGGSRGGGGRDRGGGKFGGKKRGR